MAKNLKTHQISVAGKKIDVVPYDVENHPIMQGNFKTSRQKTDIKVSEMLKSVTSGSSAYISVSREKLREILRLSILRILEHKSRGEDIDAH